jgi:hypothetical protein
MRPSALALFLVLPLSADGLTSLKSNLAKLNGGDPVKATVDYGFWRQTTEDKKPVQSQGKVTVHVEDGPQGLRLGWGKQVLQQAAQEGRAQSKDPEKTSGTRTALRAVDALEATELLNYAEPMLRNLEGAQLVEERPDTWQGQPARLLILKVEPKMAASQKKYMKKMDVQARVWVGADGLPLATSLSTSFTASRFFISFEGTQKEERHFLQSGNRLVVAYAQAEDSNSGFGQSTASKKTTTVNLN